VVLGAEGARVGRIKAVREDHLVVEHGTLARHDLYIPIDALAITVDGSPALNVRAGQVDSQGWRFPPTSALERRVPATPDVPDTTIIQAAGYSAGMLSAAGAQGFVLDADLEAAEALDEEN